MTEWYCKWAAKHITAFALPEKAFETFAELGKAWSKFFTEAELHTATEELKYSQRRDADGKSSLAFAESHRLAVPDAVKRVRAKMIARATASSEPPPRCHNCDDSGIAIVPHPGKKQKQGYDATAPLADILTSKPQGFNAYGEPIYHTLGVLCGCHAGKKIEAVQRSNATADSKRTVSLTLEEYDARYGNWQTVQYDIRREKEASRVPMTAEEVQQSRATIQGLAKRLARELAIPSNN